MDEKEKSSENVSHLINKFFICLAIQDKLINASMEQLIEITKILNI